jgi:hypothetical protein
MINTKFAEDSAEPANQSIDVEKVVDSGTVLSPFENKKNLIGALINFHTHVKSIPKDQQGYNYKYAALETILKHIKEPLINAGLAITQLISGENNLSITTILWHVSGEYISSKFTIDFDRLPKSKNFNQELGSSMTYLKRYCLIAALGISPDEDSDGVVVESRNEFKNNSNKKWPKKTVKTAIANMEITGTNPESEAMNKLNSCKNLQELKVTFKSLGAQASNPAVIAHKDSLKLKFEDV